MERGEFIAGCIALLLILIGCWSYVDYESELNYDAGYSAGYVDGNLSGHEDMDSLKEIWYDVGRGAGINYTEQLCTGELIYWMNKTRVAVDVLEDCGRIIDVCIKECPELFSL